MNNKDLIAYTIKGMKHRQLRSWLTILGIVIGIASVVIMISLAQGIQGDIQASLDKLGSNYVAIAPGSLNIGSAFQFGPPKLKGILTVRDAEAIARVEGVTDVSKNIVLSFTPVEYKKEVVNTNVIGVTPSAYKKFLTIGLEKGRFIEDGDASGIVIGHNIATDLFDEEIKVGTPLTIKDKTFRVTGVLNSFGQGGNNVDDSIFLDERAARLIAGDSFDKNRVSSILALTDGKTPPSEMSEKISDRLRSLHKVKKGDEDFTVLTAESIAQQVGQITGLLTLFLGGVAAISLLVGGVGIANSMFTNVLERTREIGILKAIGASNKEVLQLFLTEAGIIGLIGGLIGIFLAVLASFAISAFGVSSGVSIGVALFALIFSIGIGMLSGYYPARNAARMPPIQALRYE
ncbi:ABC transporter permease [Candidatus Micrarchaeota archaeon]|nr:ABC transporter permease [Candidatus Micrarchaeota archaeon]